MRSAGVPVDMLAKYVRLFQMGDSTLEERKNLLENVRIQVKEQLDKYQAATEKLNYKISKYEEAIHTGVLEWTDENLKKEENDD